jgi:predicted 3-demethylubiquinone-9 3-methyltransferase (glyoxalase superfamily)
LEEIDNTWQKLQQGGSILMPLNTYPWSENYGWLNDTYGISWQLSLGKLSDRGQKITPLLMFAQEQAGNAERAIHFYTSVFKDSSVKLIARYEPGEPDVEGRIKHAQFKLGEQLFMAMDTSMPNMFGFTEGISFMVPCDT